MWRKKVSSRKSAFSKIKQFGFNENTSDSYDHFSQSYILLSEKLWIKIELLI